MKTIKPQRLGVLTRTFEREGKCFLVTTVLVGYRFDDPETPVHEAALWKEVTENLDEEVALDEAMVKPRGEVLVTGRAYQPGGKKGIGCAVRLTVGALDADGNTIAKPLIDKQLYVVGDREWGATGPSEPEPFMAMPVSWSRAFGGEGHPPNPLGTGAEAVVGKDGVKRTRLPNVEDPKSLIQSRGDKPKPVGFGPVDARSSLRRQLGGTYDKKWLETVYPGFPADFDWEFFNIAPRDQRLDGFFDGGIDFIVENMHPSKPKVIGRTPKLRARCFITRAGEGDTKEFRDVPTKLDTIHLFPDRELAVACFRGVTEVDEDDADDVLELMIACERDGESKPLSHYRQTLDNRLDKEMAAVYFLRDSDLLPPLPPDRDALGQDEISDLPELLAVESLLAKNLRKKAERELETMREICRQHDVDPDEHLPRELPPAVDEKPPLDQLDTYIESKRAEAEAARKDAEKRQEEALDAARRMCADNDIDFDALMESQKNDGAGPPKFRAADELQKLRDMQQLSLNAGVPLVGVDQKLDDPLLLERLRETERQLQEAYRRNAHDFPAASLHEPAEAEQIAVRLRAAVDGDESLAGCDYTGAGLSDFTAPGADMKGIFLEASDLSGADLSGADLSDAVLVRANLTGANLSGAKLVGANLGCAILDGADLSGCDLTLANLTRAHMKDTRLDGATLQEALILEAVISGGSFAGIRAKQLVFLELDMSNVDLSGAELPQCIFIDSQMTDAAFGGALLEGACFVTVNLNGCNFEDARCNNLRVVHGCSMDGTSFKNAQLAGANLRGTSMRGANLQNAIAPKLDLSGCDLEGASLEQLVAPDALLIRTNLKGAKLTRANLMQAILQKANIEGADFGGANLFQGDFAKIRGNRGTNFEGANMKFIRFVNREQHGQS